MAIYHLSVKPVSRSAGRSATAAAAYRAAEMIECEREGRTHDYTRKQGVAHSEILVPSEASWAQDRSTLWNAAEAAEKRSNSTVAREYELALPAELSARSRVELVRAFGAELRDRYGVAVDIAIHAPHREGDQRNWHAHVLTTTRKVEETGLGAKTRILDDRKSGPAQVLELRAVWAELSNQFLEREGLSERVDHRSLEAIREAHREEGREHLDAGRVEKAREAFSAAVEADRPAQAHMGPAASAMERKTEREALVSGRDYEPATRIGAEVLRARQFREAAQHYASAWLDVARAHYTNLSERLETAFSRIKERFAGQARGIGREGENERDAAPERADEARSFLARREGAEDFPRPAQALTPDAQRGSFLDRRAQGASPGRGGDGSDLAAEPRGGEPAPRREILEAGPASSGRELAEGLAAARQAYDLQKALAAARAAFRGERDKQQEQKLAAERAHLAEEAKRQAEAEQKRQEMEKAQEQEHAARQSRGRGHGMER